MATSEVPVLTRELLVQLRRAALIHDEAVAAARLTFDAAASAAEAAETAARDEARARRDEADLAALTERQAASEAAAASLAEARRHAASYAESIRTHWNGADTALGLADLRSLHDVAQHHVTAITNEPRGVDAERELSRCVSEAGKAARRIDGTVQQALSRPVSTRRVFPRLLFAALIAVSCGAVLIHQAAQPCSFVRTAMGGHAGCATPLKKHGRLEGTPAPAESLSAGHLQQESPIRADGVGGRYDAAWT